MAASQIKGPELIIAGAGSGKTRMITYRIANMLDKGIDESEILALTFTNKAAKEMADRVRETTGKKLKGLTATTFHSFGLGLLKQYIQYLGYRNDFTLYDENDNVSLVRNCIVTCGFELGDYNTRSLREFFSSYKTGRMALPEKGTAVRDIYDEWLLTQKAYNVVDFDDLILLPITIFEKKPDILEKVQDRYRYIMVDEFQDIDKDQYSLADILSGYHHNLFVVGDPDQTIYTWRGADVKFILEFPARHPGAKTIYLNQNYRSAPQILAASNALIDKNRDRLKKELTPVRGDNRKPLYFHAKTSQLEADWITANMRALHEGEDEVSYSQMGVLYRAHYVSRALEESLIRNKIPYVLYSGVEFYKRKEIKDVLCYLRMIYNPDDISFLRTVNEPRRGVGRTRIAALKAYAAAKGCGLYQALLDSLETDSFRRCKAKDYVRLIEKYRAIYDNMDLTDLLAGVLHESGYENMLRTSGEEERLDNLAELKQAIFDFTRKAGETVTLGNYLDHAALFTNMDTQEKAQAVKLMTIHSAKGLEFPIVFLCGLSEGIFPGKRANTREKLEEERRLCYVAFTRAKDRLFLSDAAGQSYDGSFRYPSRFLFNAEKENVDYVVPLDPDLEEKTMASIRDSEDLTPNTPVKSDLVGKRVKHVIFGEGTVIGIPRDNQGVIVQFDSMVTPRTFSDLGKLNFS